MTKLNEKLFTQIENVAKSVRQQLRNKGYIVPQRGPNNSYIFERYTVKKDYTGFYSIVNSNNEIIVQQINLPQTAALIANNLALGKFLDSKLIELDTNYGYKEFDYQVFKNAAERNKSKDLDLSIFYETRCKMAESLKKEYKKQIQSQFDKLCRLR
jgi:hypothetical protein